MYNINYFVIVTRQKLTLQQTTQNELFERSKWNESNENNLKDTDTYVVNKYLSRFTHN